MIIVPSTGKDLTARDQIALTNMRLMIQTAITTGALGQGKQWELSTNEWAASSTNETYAGSGLSFYRVVLPETLSGNLTSGGGLAAARDGVTAQALGATAGGGNGPFTAADIVIDFGSGNTITATEAKMYSSSDYGFSNNGVDYNLNVITLTVYGSNTSNTGPWTQLSQLTGQNNTTGSTQTKTLTIASPAAYRYYKGEISRTGGGNVYAALAEFELTPNSPGGLDMTLIPDAAVTVSSAPVFMDAYFLWKDDSGSAVIGTDLTVELSRDNGTTYTAATLSTLAAYDSTYSVIKARANVGAQPSGTSMLCRIKTLNSKAQRIAAPALYAE